jgi:hypothetical protein
VSRFTHRNFSDLTATENKADSVQHIFRRYAALGSVRLLQQELLQPYSGCKTACLPLTADELSPCRGCRQVP